MPTHSVCCEWQRCPHGYNDGATDTSQVGLNWLWLISHAPSRAVEHSSKKYCPSFTSHKKSICTFEALTPELVENAIDGALKAKTSWENLPLDERAAVFLKAADLLATKYRAKINASVMHGQSKTLWQAEIDAAVETIDFWRFGAKFAKSLYQIQPTENDFGVWNRMEYRPLEGFVSAITPFNFLAIGANLPSTPVLMGNVALWKPAENSVHGAKIIYDVLTEAGLPEGVIQFLPGEGLPFAQTTLRSPDLAAVHFTGSTTVFDTLWNEVGKNLSNYKTYPRLVGETGGKNFHVVHETADVDHVINSTIRGAFEFQGQKCSATSRMYVPKSLWPRIREGITQKLPELKIGSPGEFDAFMGAVINRRAFDRVSGYIKRAKESPSCQVDGGAFDDSKGYFIEPTMITTTDPSYESMREEIFGPVLTVYVYEVLSSKISCNRRTENYSETFPGAYGGIRVRASLLRVAHLGLRKRTCEYSPIAPSHGKKVQTQAAFWVQFHSLIIVCSCWFLQDDKFEETLELCDKTTAYALTGAVFARDRGVINYALNKLRHTAGNISCFLNFRSTGSIVGQQPFGGSRKSGTNDKSGSANCYMRFCSPRSIKENFLPLGDVSYPSMASE
uniref:L-glutamate gamma-semialdehyde dehydrogenase n=1 Tax=Rhodosorus marinus TaxID=101924 RepID=A0A7S3A6D8_9RHOD|mmetsp:Transcript_511/g.902  ORF Transcript_511/g.902 Transcript_511/m.902 type:complete len:618 (+) Transcript_511:244-2097(+)